MPRTSKRISGSPGLSVLVPFVLAWALLLLALFLRTTGLHIDENNYLMLAERSATDDSRSTSKPPLFCAVNYAFFHGIGKHLGFLAPVSLLAFYLAILAAALVYAVEGVTRSARLDRRARGALYVAVLSAPLFLYNATQLMMELPVFAALLATIGAYARLLARDSTRLRVGVGMSLATAFAFKLTAAFAAVGLLAATPLAFARRRRFTRLGPIAAVVALGLAGGVVAVQTHLRLIRPFATVRFAGWGELSSADGWAERLSWTRGYFSTWAFFLGPALLGAGAAYAVARKRRPPAAQPGLWFWMGLAAGSLPLMHAVQLSSAFDFVRYSYPALLTGLFGAAVATVLLEWRISVAVSAFQALLSVSLFGTAPGRFAPWPASLVKEHFESGGTRLRNIPVWALATRTSLRGPSPCLFVNREGQEHSALTLQFFRFAFPGSSPFEEADFSRWNSEECGRRGRAANLVWHTETMAANPCLRGCAGFRFNGARHEHCGYQPVRWYNERPGDTIALDCWTP